MNTNKIAPIDHEALLRLTGQNKDLANELLSMFVQELPEMRELTTRYFAEKDFKELAQVVHKLHGSCCYCAAKELQRLARAIEAAIKNGTPNEMGRLILQMEEEMMLVIDHIENNKVS